MRIDNIKTDISFAVNLSTINQIYQHFKLCDSTFTPPLSDRVNLKKYSTKIFFKGTKFEAWHHDLLVGIVAAYFDDSLRKSAYVTNVSVDPVYTNLGIAKFLMKRCLDFARESKVEEVVLHVFKSNERLVRFYSKLGFDISVSDDEQMEMRLFLEI
jgi:ribosomal protein S18 acetylase RimI-like enzyme